jgi:hypothetical protein
VMTDDETVAPRQRTEATYARKSKPPPVFADRGKCMCMKNGERCHARWLPKDHVIKTKRQGATSFKMIL